MKLKFRADSKSIVKFLIVCLMILYVVAIVILNASYFLKEGLLWGLNPFPAFNSEYIVATLVFFVVTIVLILSTCSSLFFEMEKGIGVTTKAKSKNDGYTKLWDKSDMKKDYGIKRIKLVDDNYDAGGFPVINDGKYAWVDNGENHSLIMGASGSGKSQSFMFPLIKILAKHGESMIVTDPKGELYEGCGNLLKEKGYKLILVNFRDPDEGAAWNPFTYPYSLYKSGQSDKANELLQDLASNILIDPANKNDPFWESTASNFFTGLALGLFDDAEEAEVNINSINMMAETGEDKLGSSRYILEYFKSKGELSPAYVAASSCINSPNETRGGILSTFRTKTRIFSSQKALSEMLSHSDFDIRDIGKEKTAVFLKIHDEKTTYHALATIFVKQVYEALIAVAQTFPNLKLPFRTNFVLDEFANMPALKDVESMITASRSRNIRFSFVIQNFSQLNKVYGKDVAETIKGNCGNFVYLMSTELAALEEISKLLGDKKPAKPKKDEPAPPIRPLFTVSDLQALKQGEVIINRFRSMPFKTSLTFDYKIDWGKKYEKIGYEKREHQDVRIFDMKGFVDKKKKEENPNGNFQGGFPNMGDGPNPFMMGGFPGMNQPANMGQPQFQNSNPFANNNNNNNMIDDYVKMLDQKIAELEAEEARENAKNEETSKEINEIKSENKELNNKLKDILSDKSEKEIIQNNEQVINNITVNNESRPIVVDTTSQILEDNIQSEVPEELPVKEHNNIEEPDDEFFDDFFGDEE